MTDSQVRLGDIIKLEYGKSLDDSLRCDDGIFFAYGANGVKARTNKYLFDKPSIIVGRKGSAGELVLVRDKFWALDVTFYVTHDKSNTDLIYLYYVLQSKNLKSLAKGVKPGINRNDIYDLKIWLPPLATQQRIVEKLDAIFAEIDKATAAAEANIKNADALFQSYLANILKYCESTYPEVILSSVCEFDKKQDMFKNLPYIGMEHIESGTSKFLGDYKVVTVASSTFYFSEEHVLYGRLRPYLNKVFLPHFKGHCSTEIFPLKVKNGLCREFLKFWIMSPKINYLINQTCTGARMPRANMNDVLRFKMNLPPTKKQHELVDVLMSQQEHCNRLKNFYVSKVRQLNSLRNSVLNDAFKVSN